jgi:hypothetical protein
MTEAQNPCLTSLHHALSCGVDIEQQLRRDLRRVRGGPQAVWSAALALTPARDHSRT